MAAHPLDPSVLQATLDMFEACGHNVSEAARKMGIVRETFQHRLERARLWAAQRGLQTADPHGKTVYPKTEDNFTVKGDDATATRLTTYRVTTLQQLVDLCQIDTKEWDITGYECGVWEVGMRPPVVSVWTEGTDGKPVKTWIREGDQPIIAQLWRVSARMKRRAPLLRSLDVLHTEIVADIKSAVAKGKPAPAPKYKTVGSNWLYEFPPVDMHFGKLTWGDETVTHYDTDIAEDLARAALEFLLARALKLTDGKIAQILYLIGNDAMHSDNRKAETTAGTRMDVDTRYPKVYRRLVTFTRWSIDRLREVAPVHGVVMPGNHDAESAFHLGELLAARYDGVKHVTIDNRPRVRKYYDWGVNLFGFAHGHVEKVAELPTLMAREEPQAWARCPSREWHIGHKHIAEKYTAQDLFSDKGVRIRRLMSLSSHDAWHTEHGFTDRRGCDAFVFHKTAGFTDHLCANIDHFTGKMMEAT